MSDNYLSAVIEASTVTEYEMAVSDMAMSMYLQGQSDEARELERIAHLQKNRFSYREIENELTEKKAAIQRYYKLLTDTSSENHSSTIITILNNFHRFCKLLYKSDIHKKCSNSIKEKLSALSIENEYDLQKLVYAVFSIFFLDARIEVAQDTGHHTVRKDVLIDSLSSVIELKCTRNGMSERELSEEVASDIIHYDQRSIYFYIYDKANIIRNEVSFKSTYEKRDVDGKEIHVIIYSHNDI